jgi:acyl CoA:acetate/3-ketoacid CoA transferase beta subunit
MDQMTAWPRRQTGIDILVTDLAQFRRKDGRLAVEQVAPGFTKQEVLALTGIDAATGMPVKAENP